MRADPPHPRQRRPAAAAIAAALTALAASSGGCNIVGPAVALMADEKVAAAYELPEKRPAVVFIDDRASVLPSRMVRQRIAQAAERTLLDEKAVGGDLVSSEALTPVIAAERFGKPRSIAELGQAVGAEVVIYAAVESFTLSANGAEYAPSAVLRVKVMDAASGQRLWPTADGQTAAPLTVNLPVRTGAMPQSASDRAQAQMELAELTGRSLAQTFFKHNRRERNPRIGATW